MVTETSLRAAEASGKRLMLLPNQVERGHRPVPAMRAWFATNVPSAQGQTTGSKTIAAPATTWQAKLAWISGGVRQRSSGSAGDAGGRGMYESHGGGQRKVNFHTGVLARPPKCARCESITPCTASVDKQLFRRHDQAGLLQLFGCQTGGVNDRHGIRASRRLLVRRVKQQNLSLATSETDGFFFYSDECR